MGHVEVCPRLHRDACFLGMVVDNCGIQDGGEQIGWLFFVALNRFGLGLDEKDELVAEIALGILDLEHAHPSCWQFAQLDFDRVLAEIPD